VSARNKQRGYELEKETADFWQGHGFDCARVFGSGAYKNQLGDDYAGDLRLEGFSVEAKRKKSGFKFLMDSLAQDNADLLVVRQDRAPRLYVLREETLLTLMREAKQ
jgi:hypothetical protein